MRRAIAILLLGAACPGLAGELVPTAAPTKVKACLVPGYQELYVAGAGLYVGGEQDAAQLEKMKSLGVKHVIDLRDAPATATSLAPDAEAEVAKGLGLTYARV
ncbi:MAG TPA: hypothetical protein VJM11_09885, partial [Nevskiaceae bacterium]|nr:hypothetical protein [Nevskiaceae bacterium]